MRRFRLLMLVISGMLMLAGCREKELDMTVTTQVLVEGQAIQSIDIEDAWNVTLVNDDHPYIELEYSAFLEEYINATFEASSGEFKLGFSRWLSLPGNTVMNAIIHTDQLQNIHLSDASVCRGGHFTQGMEVEIDDASQLIDIEIEGNFCSIKLSDASVFKGTLTVTNVLNIEVEDASHLVTYGGHAPQANVKVEDASFMNLLSTEVHEMHIEVSDASEAHVFVTGALQGWVSDASKLYYSGNSTLNVDCDETSILQQVQYPNP